jgi:two-component system OmpR family response regulator
LAEQTGVEVRAMKLLMVEDDEKIAAAVKRGLEAEGFAVEVSADGDDGFWRATEGIYDLILLDIMLPGRNGYRLCADLRAAGNWTPILMLTAKDGDLDEAEALDTGADDYLVKPFSFPVLIARVRALLRRAGGRDPAPVSAGGLRIDPGARRVWLDDREVGLTTREFDVLEFLLRRAGQVLSKSQILAGVWSDDFDGDPNIVEVYIGRLRRKIDGPDALEGTITTVRGAGYRLGAG